MSSEEGMGLSASWCPDLPTERSRPVGLWDPRAS